MSLPGNLRRGPRQPHDVHKVHKVHEVHDEHNMYVCMYVHGLGDTPHRGISCYICMYVSMYTGLGKVLLFTRRMHTGIQREMGMLWSSSLLLSGYLVRASLCEVCFAF